MATTPARRGRARQKAKPSVSSRGRMSVVTEYVPAVRKTSKPASARPADSRFRLASMSSRKAVKYASGSARASATAYWKGPEETYVRNCLAERPAETSAGGAVIQPTFQPVKEKVLPAEPI